MILIYGCALYGVFGSPVLLLWSWNSWIRNPTKNISGYLALCGLVIATASALLALGTFAYGQSIGGFGYYDHRLMRAYSIGFLISITAFAVSLGGIWKKNTLRWLSPAAAIGTVLFWICAASAE